MPVAELRPASTVVVLRASEINPVEVLLMRRNDQVAFMAGAFVFPGGRVDDEDRAQAVPPSVWADSASRFPGLTLATEWPYRVAAVRELQEEASVTVRPGELTPLAHWVTPEIETRRYDTRFFLVRMPEGQVAAHDAGEMTELVWLTPSESIARCRRGEIMLPPPTWTTLKQLTGFRSIDATFAWAQQKPIVLIQPRFVETGAARVLTLPGDPLYPPPPGWETPEDTRFVLEQGKGWIPARA